MTAKEYRDNARECLGWAHSARTPKERETFVEMANTWLAAAIQCELRECEEQMQPQEQNY